MKLFRIARAFLAILRRRVGRWAAPPVATATVQASHINPVARHRCSDHEVVCVVELLRMRVDDLSTQAGAPLLQKELEYGYQLLSGLRRMDRALERSWDDVWLAARHVQALPSASAPHFPHACERLHRALDHLEAAACLALPADDRAGATGSLPR